VVLSDRLSLKGFKEDFRPRRTRKTVCFNIVVVASQKNTSICRNFLNQGTFFIHVDLRALLKDIKSIILRPPSE